MRIAVDVGVRSVEDKVFFLILYANCCNAVFCLGRLYTKNIFYPCGENVKLNIFKVIETLEFISLEIYFTVVSLNKGGLVPSVEVFGNHCTVGIEA